jgi:hypothetical protein
MTKDTMKILFTFKCNKFFRIQLIEYPHELDLQLGRESKTMFGHTKLLIILEVSWAFCVIVVANLLSEKIITTTLGGDNMSQMVLVLKWLC